MHFKGGSWVASLCLFLSLITFSRCSIAQVILPGAQTGSPVNSSDDQHGTDSVNTENLGLHIDIPLLTIQERGRTYTVRYVYNNPIYTVQFFPYPGTEPDGETGNWVVRGALSGVPSNWNIVTPNSWQLADDTSPSANCEVGPSPGGGEDSEEYVLHTNYRLIDPEGTQHPLGMVYKDVIGTGAGAQNLPSCPAMQTNLTSPTLDGTAAEVDLTQNAFWIADGTRYTVDNSDAQYPVVTQVEDRNGNLLASNRVDTDMMNRTVFKILSSSQTQDVYQYRDSNGALQSITINYTSVPYQTDDCSVVSDWLTPNKCVEGSGAYRLPQSIVLPNNQEYSFTYNSNGHGELTSMTLPFGATITYTYQRIETHASERTGSKAGASGYSPAYFHYGVSHRTVTNNGVTALWQYTTTNDGSEHPTYTTTVEDPNGNCVVHYYGTVDSQHLYGLAELTTVYKTGCGSSVPVLKTVATTYDYSSEAVPGGTLDAYFIRPHVVTTTLTGGEASQVQTDYETFTSNDGFVGSWDNPTEIREYDFGASTPTRITDYTYLDQVGSSTRTAAQYLANHIVKQRATETISNASSPLVKTTYDYDNYGGGITRSSAYGLDTTYGNWGNATKKTVTDELTGTSYVSSYTYEDTGNIVKATDPLGNATTYSYTDSWTNSSCALSSGQQGHIYLTKVTNAKQQDTQYTYNSCTGTLASIIDANTQTTTFQYDPLGRTTQVGYADGGQTSFCYNDTFCQSSSQVPPYSTVVTQLLQASSNLAKTTTTIYDGLGRPTQTQLTDPYGTDYQDTTYDGLGQVASVSTWYRTTSDSTYALTSFTYDGLGRKVIQANSADGSKLQWCFNNQATNGQTNCHARIGSNSWDWVDASDENGNDWQRTSDALGRLTSVFEPGGASTTPLIETDYSYDVLGNLLTATQRGQSGSSALSRTFSYDGFSRLLSASNPETGTTSYTYDANGNVLTKTSPLINSASGTQKIGYVYDALNRLCSKAQSASDADVQTCPAQAPSNAIVAYTYDTSSVSGAQNTIGRLTDEVSYSGSSKVSERQLYSFDAMGRLLKENQITFKTPTNWNTYSPQYRYDLAGNLVASTDGATPIQSTNSTFPCTPHPDVSSWTKLSFVNCYDSAGRLNSMTSNWSPLPTNLFTIGEDGYFPEGQLKNWKQGPTLSIMQNYTKRLWLNSITATGQVP